MSIFLIREPKCVFIHIPKTGGASIRHGFFGGNVDGPRHGEIPTAWQRYFKFAFVRNPYDRFISAWKMFRSGMHQTVWDQPEDARNISLPEFLRIALDETIRFDGRRSTTEEKIRHHVIPQTHPFNCLDQADFIGRFENLQDDFAKICQRLAIDFTRLPHWNRTEAVGDAVQCLDEDLLKAVEEFYREDFAKLGYRMISARR